MCVGEQPCCGCACVLLLLLKQYLKQITQTLKLDLEEEQQLVIVANTVKHLTCVSEDKGRKEERASFQHVCCEGGYSAVHTRQYGAVC